MSEKLNTLRNVCSVVGLVAIIVYALLLFGENYNIFLVLRIIFASIALSAYSIECGAKIVSNEKIAGSVFMVAMCFIDIIFTALWFI